MTEKNRRDRDGEPFEDDFTDDRGSRPAVIEEAQHDLNLVPDQVDESGADEEVRDAKKDDH
jgi:hypothetical protein